MTYSVSASGYLQRARHQLKQTSPESLFYAAFELRCFVEARHDEYLQAQKEYAKSIPKPYKIAARGKVLGNIFRNDRIQYVSWESQGKLDFEAFHIPVSAKLRNGAEWLGNLLHAQMLWRSTEDKWWAETRERVLSIYRLAWACEKGNLPSPLFLKDGKIIGTITFLSDAAEQKQISELFKVGKEGVLHVRYPKHTPESWICDL